MIHDFQKWNGFTLIELIITVAIFVVLSLIGIVFLGSFTRERALVEETKKIADYLKIVQTKSQSQELGSGWGAHIANPVSGQSWYGLFQGKTYPGSASATIYLASRLDFFSPADGLGTDIIFEAPSGRAMSDATITVMLLKNPAKVKSIFIKTTGLIYHE